MKVLIGGNSVAKQFNSIFDTTEKSTCGRQSMKQINGFDLAGSREDVHFVVRDGDFLYPLSTASAGWGSTISGSRSARVYALRRVDANGRWLLLGEAELRTFPAHPEENARLFTMAKDALVQQGCLARVGRPIDLPDTYRIPIVGFPAQAKRFWRRVESVAKLRALGRMRQATKQWSIGLAPRSSFALGPDFPWASVHWVASPSDGFIADPCVVDDGPRTWLFYEKFLYPEGKGTLWVTALNGDGNSCDDAHEVLRTDQHLSFPQIFKEGDDWFLLPEQAHSGATSLFKAVDFPHRWVKYRDILPDFPGIDPILLRRKGKWWLFVTFGVYPCNESNLHLFMADSLNDEFVAHPMSPVHTGLRGSRMAGAVCELDGRLIRPGQDGTEGYGNGVIVFEILRLDSQVYEERELHAWRPYGEGEFNQGFHTFSVSRDLIAIDAQRTREDI